MANEPKARSFSSDSNPFFDLERKANEYRSQTLEMCITAKTGHVTSCMSCAEIMTVLYNELMDHNPHDPKWEDRDRFVLSKGQASPLLYVILADHGYFPREHLDKFVRGDDGKGANAPFGVHLQCDVPGVEFTTGSLGHGLGYGAGMAKATKMDGRNNRVFVLLGDGELYEGSNWETAFYAGHHRLDNLIGLVDRNRQCTNGYTEQHILRMDPVGDKFEAFGWNVKEVNGHSVTELVGAIENYDGQRPLMIVAETEKGMGVKCLEGRKYFHGLAPTTPEDIAAARRDLAEFTAQHRERGGYDV
jgi:transketolase